MLFLLFQIGEARYALDTATVLEIVPPVALKTLPGAPRGVAGLLDYHGTPIPVLDLGELTASQPAQIRFSTRLILVRLPAQPDHDDASPRTVGLLAERATTLLQREPADFAHPGLYLPDAPFLGPVTADAEGFIQRLFLDKLLTGPLRALLAPARELTLP